MVFTWSWMLLAFLVGLALGLGIAYGAFKWMDRDKPPEPQPLVTRAGTPKAEASDRLLVGPPRVDGETLMRWLIRYSRNDKVWERIVEEFYRRAAERPAIKRYFAEVLARENGWAELQAHFHGALVRVTHVGLTESTANLLEEKHKHLNISNEDFLATVQILVQVLQENTPGHLHNSLVRQLTPIVEELRIRLVRGGVFAQ